MASTAESRAPATMRSLAKSEAIAAAIRHDDTDWRYDVKIVNSTLDLAVIAVSDEVGFLGYI